MITQKTVIRLGENRKYLLAIFCTLARCAFSQYMVGDTVFYDRDDNLQVSGYYTTANSNPLARDVELSGGVFDLSVECAETVTNFAWTVPDLTSVLLPAGWGSVYDAGSSLLTVFSEDGGICEGQAIEVAFTFGNSGCYGPVRELQNGVFVYAGVTTGGTLAVAEAVAALRPKLLSVKGVHDSLLASLGETNCVAMEVRASEGRQFNLEYKVSLTSGTWRVLGC